MYGCWGRRNRSVTDARSTCLPMYITTTSSAISAITPRLCVMNWIAMPVVSCRLRTKSRMTASVVTSRAVVGSSAIRMLGLHASAIPITARWRMPPDSWCGYLPRTSSGRGRPT